MRRRDWWTGIVVVVVALLLHAAFPRYELVVRDNGVFRWDRWTGHVDASASLLSAPWATVSRPQTVWDEADKLLATPPPARKP